MKNESEQIEGIQIAQKSNKTKLYVIVGVVLVVLLGGFFLVKNLTRQPVAEVPEEEEETLDLPQVDSSVLVDLTPRADGKAVLLKIDKIPSGTNSIEYELSYTTDKDLPKGAIGKIELGGKSDIEREVLLGTCSRNVCTYDTGVKSVSLVLRFNANKGASQFSKEYSLE